jgi:hypothetical protein
MNKEDEILELLKEIQSIQQTWYNEWKLELAKSEQIRSNVIKESEQRINQMFGMFSIKSGWPTQFTQELPQEKGEYYEAREWLKNNNNPSPLASNRFMDKEEALEFVERLYKAGSEKVSIVHVKDEPDRIAEEGGPYSDYLVVTLPEESKKRRALFKIHSTEAKNEGFDTGPDTGEKELFFWWD